MDRTESRLVRLDRVAELTRDGKSITEIAVVLNVTARTVQRDRASLGISRPVDRPPLTKDELDTICALLDDGAPAKEAARTVGCSDRTVRKHFPGRGWTAQQTAEFVAAVRQARRAVAS